MKFKIGNIVKTKSTGEIGEIINANNSGSVFRVKFKNGVSPMLPGDLISHPELSFVRKYETNGLGTKYNQGKPMLHLVPEEAIIGIAEGLEYGISKYGKWNFKKGLSYTDLTDSLRRHTLAFLSGEDIDPESGIEHTKLILSNSAMLEWMRKNRPDQDDRYKGEK